MAPRPRKAAKVAKTSPVYLTPRRKGRKGGDGNWASGQFGTWGALSHNAAMAAKRRAGILTPCRQERERELT
jgi:hypothetical protein